MITELAKFDDDARTRQTMSDWTNVLLRLRSRPVRLGMQRGVQSIFSRKAEAVTGAPTIGVMRLRDSAIAS